MSDIDSQVKTVFRRILKDIQVELGEEFDENFERQAFFTQAWARRKSPTRPGGHILVDSGRLRQSITSRTTDNSITLYTTEPYAAIHNEGGAIKVTAKMKRFFWYKYYSATGSFGRKKDGSMRNDKRNRQLGTEADFWKAMALMKVGATIKIPKRQFLCTSPEVEAAVREIIEENLTDYINDIDFNIK